MNWNNRLTAFGLTVLVLFASCSFTSDSKEVDGQKDQTEEAVEKSKAEAFINAIEKAHQKEIYVQKEVIQFDINLSMGGELRFEGQISMTPNGELVRMQDSMKTMIWDGVEAYLFPDTSLYSKARFDLLTWSYFFAAPYKLADPGTNHEWLGKMPLNEIKYETLRLTFQAGVGDSPDDWYMIYKDESTDLLAAMAYIVTYSKRVDRAEENPHVITYEAYEKIEGILFATRWNFWTWNEQGELNKLLGEAVISNIKFIKKANDLFQPPAHSKIAEKPEV